MGFPPRGEEFPSMSLVGPEKRVVNFLTNIMSGFPGLDLKVKLLPESVPFKILAKRFVF